MDSRGGEMSWKNDKRWSDKFICKITPILGANFIAEPPIEEDRDRNTDLIVLNLKEIRFGCRVRKNDYYSRYPNEFTIRSKRPSGQETEIKKIMNGWGDYFFYGFANKDETDLIDWFIGDLQVLREWIINQKKQGRTKKKDWNIKNNIDDSSEFLILNKKDLPHNFIFASKFQ